MGLMHNTLCKSVCSGASCGEPGAPARTLRVWGRRATVRRWLWSARRAVQSSRDSRAVYTLVWTCIARPATIAVLVDGKEKKRERERERERERGEEKDLIRARGNTRGDSHTWVLFLALRNENASHKSRWRHASAGWIVIHPHVFFDCFCKIVSARASVSRAFCARERYIRIHVGARDAKHVRTSSVRLWRLLPKHSSRETLFVYEAQWRRDLSLSLSSLSSRPCFLHSGGKLRSRRGYDIAPFTVRISLRTPKKCFMFWPHDSVEGVYLPRKKKKENKISIVSRISHFA